MLAVHGRTRCQMYNGSANWCQIADVVAATGLPVLANGDIRDLADVTDAMAESGARGVMI